MYNPEDLKGLIEVPFPLRIYVAGPISAESDEAHEINIRKVMLNFKKIFDMGHFPFTSHPIAHYAREFGWASVGNQEEKSDTNWTYHNVVKVYDMSWVNICHAMFLSDGWETSTGAEMEIEKFVKYDRMIFDDISQIPKLSPEWQKYRGGQVGLEQLLVGIQLQEIIKFGKRE